MEATGGSQRPEEARIPIAYVDAISVQSGSQPFRVAVYEEAPLKAGIEDKWQIEGARVRYDGQIGEAVSLIERRLAPWVAPMWMAFREAGLPVVPDLCATDRGTYFVPNVKGKGEFYGKALYHAIATGSRTAGRPETDAHFLDITSPAHFPAVAEQVEQYTAIANKCGLILPSDDPFELRVNPDGTQGFFILDLRLAMKRNIARGGVEASMVAQSNACHGRTFLATLAGIRKRLSAY